MASYRAALTAIDPTPPDAAAIAIPPLYHGYAGFLATLPVTLVVAPAERVKILLQIQRGATSPPLGAVLRTLWMPPPQPSRTPARSPLATWLDVARFGGRGFGWTLARDGIGNFCYFATYEAMRTRLIPPPPPPPASTREGAPEPLGQRMRREGFGILMSGALAGIACWTVCLPFDTIKSRVQTSLARDPTDVALARVLQQLRAEGSVLKGLYRGLTPTLLRAFPASAAFFLGMETAKTGLDYLWP
ncbi:mitochondrial carrier [Caulochytrium protostelioides]|uniref:Mitochondrial carrier n=1 Tax=Caulochytrium protostelioides TaxID=1555241 RepID=A0A4P9X0A6_9FUNG|nr:mitochondrial carrier [Caulochytrium protostelioides]